MSVNKYYPPLSSIVHIDKLPEQFSFIKGSLSSILNKILVKSYRTSRNELGDKTVTNLTLRTYNELSFDLPGCGLSLILNPPEHEIAPGVSEFEILINSHNGILNLLRTESIANFSFEPKAYFDLILQFLGLSYTDLYEQAVYCCTFDYKLASLIDEINSFYSLSPAISIIETGILRDDIDILLIAISSHEQLKSQEKDASNVIFDVFINYSNPNDDTPVETRLNALFTNQLGESPIDRIKQMLIPRYEVIIKNLGLAIEFPNTYLKPIDPKTNKPYLDTTKKSMLRFIAGTLKFSTEYGIEFEDESAFSFDKSEIANTGIMVSFSHAKLDLSKNSSIAEATAAGYDESFVGVFVAEAEIDLPLKWNHNADDSTAVIKGYNLLIGSGGFSGKLELSAKEGISTKPLIKVKLGKFDVELDSFSLTFHKDSVTACSIKGALTIPGFYNSEGKSATIAITVSFDAKGNFEIMACEKKGILITYKNNNEPVYSYNMKELAFGKKDDDYFIETSGTLHFDENTPVAKLLSGDFELNKLRIWEDGKIELDGGTIPLPKGTKVKLGPVTVFITAIHFGSTQRSGRKYNYFGFDGGVNINPGGVDARGTGIKYCYTVDGGKFDSYISIDSFSIDIIIPSSAKPEDATVLIHGWVSITNETLDGGTTPVVAPDGTVKNETKTVNIKVYAGGISIILPKVKLAAYADMKYSPDVPAWIIDMGLELPGPIPLGPSGLGIYGFRGLVGQRYVATKQAAKLSDEATWFDYYKAPPKEGICVQKFQPPFGPNGFGKGFSVGAGVSLATSADGGNAFSCKLFLLLSLPEILIFEGKANMLSTRVGLTSEDPPFFAYLAISSQSVETGFGLNYKIPKDTGDILDLYVQMEAAFFFHNPKAWYVHFGTKEKPIVAKVISFLTGQSYLMLSAMGIEAGASCEFNFTKKYLGGSLTASVMSYTRMSGHISFQRPQIGAQASIGGSVDVRIFGCSFYLGFDCSLSIELPHPFYIEGSAMLEVRVKILFKKVKKKFQVEFRWEKSKDEPNDFIIPLEAHNDLDPAKIICPVKALNIISNELFYVRYLDQSEPETWTEWPEIDNYVIPMDSYIDIEFTKPVYPNNVTEKIGGVAALAESYKESIPPEKINYQSTHSYAVEDISVYCLNDNKKWVEYFPYQAMMSHEDFACDKSQLTQLGQWQIQSEGEYKRIRLLAQSVFSYMDPGLKGWVKPQEYGITPSSLFCVGIEKKPQYANWSTIEAGTKVHDGYENSKIDASKIVYYKFLNEGSGTIQYKDNNYNIEKSLYFNGKSTLRIKLPDSSAYTRLKLYTCCKYVTITYYQIETFGFIKGKKQIKQEKKSKYELLAPLVYSDKFKPVDFIEIEPVQADATLINTKQNQIDELKSLLYSSELEDEVAIIAQIALLQQEIDNENANAYDGFSIDKTKLNNQIESLQALLNRLTNSRDLNLREATRLKLIYDTAKAKMDSCCDTMLTPPQSTDRTTCITNLQNLLPIDTSLDEVEHDYNAFKASLQILSDGLNRCKETYTLNIDALCTNAHGFLANTLEKSTIHQNNVDSLNKEISKVLSELEELHKLTTAPENETLPSNVDKNCTILHEVEWMSLKDFTINEEMPGKDAIQKSYLQTVNAIKNNVSPVWRPGMKYILSIKVSDTLKNNSKSVERFNFGFKTARPVGFFQVDYDEVAKNLVDAKNVPYRSNYVKDIEHPNIYKLTSLRDYIDYGRSYPNADGNLLKAKPLYYKNTALQLFYVKSFVYNLFANWPQNNALGLKELNGKMEIVIKDPIEEIEIANPLGPNIVSKTIPTSNIKWKKDNGASAPKSISVWDIMQNPQKYKPDYKTNDSYCWDKGGETIVPAWISTTVTFDFLKPSKLYTALFNNVFEKKTSEVHRYVFQTSRYADLADQIESYLIHGENSNIKEAVFDLSIAKLEQNKSTILKLINRIKTDNNYLDSTYIDPFDCLIEGVFKMNPLPPALNTEINIVKNESGKVKGLLIRNPEPFIDPKLPDTEKALFCSIINVNTTESQANKDFKCLFSKDCAQFFITDINSFELTNKLIRLQFTSVCWDGSENKYITDQIYLTNNITIF